MAPTEFPAATDIADYLTQAVSRRQWLQTTGSGLLAALMTGIDSPLRVFAANPKTAPYLVLIVLDGARWEYFDVPNIPHVRRLVQSGTRYPTAFAGMLESETPSGHTAIASGSEPSRNGILSFSWAENNATRVSLFDPTRVRAGAMETIVRRSRVPTIAGRVHAALPGSRVVALSGSKYYAADAIGGPDADITMYFHGTGNGQFVPTSIPRHDPPAGILTAPDLSMPLKKLTRGMENHLAMKLAVDTFEKVRQQVTLINLPEFDWPLGHVDGGIRDPGTIRTLMQSFDSDLAMLRNAYRKARVLHRTIFVVMGDHGMMPLTHRVSAKMLVDAILASGAQIVAQSFSTAAYFWLKDPSRQVPAATRVLALKHPNIQSVYVRTRTKTGYTYQAVGTPALDGAGMAAANAYLLQTFAGPKGPDLVVLFTEGAGSEPGGQSGWKADHGGANWQAQHLPLIISGPGVRAGQVSASPARLIDVAPTVLRLMGASHQGMQGIPLADAMTSPPPWTVRWQRTANRRLTPLVQALQRQSAREAARK